MSSRAPESFASSVACRTASAAVSEPSVPTTMRVNIPPPPLMVAWTGGRILTRGLLPVVPLETVAEDLGRGGDQLHGADHHRRQQADDENHERCFPQCWHGTGSLEST